MPTKNPTNRTPGWPSTVAEFPERGSSVRLVREWLKLPAVSGLQCIQALRRAGFIIQSNLGGVAELYRDGIVVEVPLADRLCPDVLAPILQRAGVTPHRFLVLLDDGP